MANDESPLDVHVALACPICGEGLASVPEDDSQLCCPTHHRFTLPTLLLNQSARAVSMFDAGTRLLDQQERLVRAIAEQVWATQPLVAFKLEGQAERLRETTDSLRRIITAGAVDNPPLRELKGNAN